MASNDEELEGEIDYSWHPSDEEFSSPITAEMWAELLGDPKFSDTDAAKAVRCLKDFGEPATFQQLSIRFRSAMGRYRRWLAEAARTAGERFGVPAPTQDQFGFDEWWPVLYQTRNAGKPGAGIFEMQLRPEVLSAYDLLDERERLARRKENALQLQRIEQLERARQEQRRREAEMAGASETRGRKKATEEVAPAPEPTAGEGPTQATPVEEPRETATPVADEPAREVSETSPAPAERPVVAPEEEAVPEQQDKPGDAEPLPATAAFLALVGSGSSVAPIVSEAMPEEPETIDYRGRYARRLREALSLIMEVEPHVTAASVARLLGDESVETLQDVLNGQAMPTFGYLDAIERTLFIGTRRLEAPDGLEVSLPTFVSLAEVAGCDAVAGILAGTDDLLEIAVITDDSRERRCALVVRFATLRCCLLTRSSVSSARRRKATDELSALSAVRAELDEFCRRRQVSLTEHEVGVADFDALVFGHIWPGWFFA